MHFISDRTPLISILYVKACFDDVVFFLYANFQLSQDVIVINKYETN